MVCQQSVQKNGTGSAPSVVPQLRHSTGNTNRRACRYQPMSRFVWSPVNIAGLLHPTLVCVFLLREEGLPVKVVAL